MNTVLFFVFATFIVGLYGDVHHLEKDPNDSDHPGYCNSSHTGLLKHGETKTLPWCIKAECHSDGSIDLIGCGVTSIATPRGNKKCEPIKDSKKPYPDCCDDCIVDEY
nr:uncharacterized protein LOC111515330 [Leptinotarsa decemlineata]